MRKVVCRHCGANLALGAVACFRCARLVESEGGVAPSEAQKAPTELGTLAREGLIDARWRLIAPVQSSPRGTTWAARDMLLDRPVTVMLLDAGLAGTEELCLSFLDEAQRWATFEHHRVDTLLAAGRAGGLPFRVTRRSEGPTLFEYVHQRSGHLPGAAAAALVVQLCEALEAIHARGLVHGDVRPSNIRISDQGRLSLAVPSAFAELLDDVWTSPERSRDRAADAWAAGVIAYELLTGAPPGPADEPGDVPPAVRACLSLDPAARAQALHALRSSLDPGAAAPLKVPLPHLPTEPAFEPIAAPTVRGPAVTPRRRTRWALTLAALVVLGALALWWRASA